ncbi:MAG: hypothetical protein QOI74_1846 [Micromonosporaceae bacterium]|jgi:DUF4097 and DUF4098 domain-containing protein YvlB|nr:hypothetical protein [Micromonosporaceae bacterium]
MMYEFECLRPITVSLRVGGGSAEIVAEERATATVEVTPFDGSESARNAAARTRVELTGDTLLVEAPEWTGLLFRRGQRVRVTIRVPADGDLNVTVASANVRAAGRYRNAKITSSSGNMSVDHIGGDASVTTASGGVRVDRVDGNLRVNSASGKLSVGAVGGQVSARTASGDVTIDRVGGSLDGMTASGDIRVGAAVTGMMRVRSASGDVSVGVVGGTGVWLDLNSASGATRTDLAMPAGGEQLRSTATLTVQVRTASGDIDVYRVQERAEAA